MKRRQSLSGTILEFCGVLFLLSLLGLAVLAVTQPASSGDEYCARSASHTC